MLLESGVRPLMGNYYGSAMPFLRFTQFAVASTKSAANGDTSDRLTQRASGAAGRVGLWSLAGGALLVGGCSKPAPVLEPVRAVKVVTVSTSKMESGSEFSGEVRARVESRFGFRLAGKVVQRVVEPGQRVKAGQLLAQLDARDSVLAAEAAKAQVTAATSNRNLTIAEYKRFSELKDQNFISGVELDRRDAAVKGAEAQLEQAQAQLSSQRNQTGYARLASDVAGVVIGVDAEAGQVVAAGQSIVRIAKDGPRDVVFSVPEDKVSLVTMGSIVAVSAWSSGTKVMGKVREVGAIADPVTRTFQVKVSMESSEALALGSTVNVIPQALSMAGVEVIKLPTSALKREGKSTAVWVVDRSSMTVKSQNVEIVSAEGNEVVVSSGVSPGMLVVAAGVHVLQAGQKVALYKDRRENDVAAKTPAPTTPVTPSSK